MIIKRKQMSLTYISLTKGSILSILFRSLSWLVQSIVTQISVFATNSSNVFAHFRTFIKIPINTSYIQNKMFFSIVLVVVVVSVSETCFAKPDAFEPNNSIKASTPIRIGQKVTMSLTPVKDLDYFKLDVPSKGVVRVAEIKGWDKKALRRNNPYIYFYDKNGKGITDDWSARVSKGAVYIRVGSSQYVGSSYEVEVKQPFSLKFTFEPENDPSEPNNSIKTARPIEFDQKIYLALTPYKDIDYLKLEIPEDGVVKVGEVNNWDKKASGENDPYIYFYDQDGNAFETNDWSAQVKKGVVYVYVASADSGGKEVKKMFSLVFTFQSGVAKLKKLKKTMPNGKRRWIFTIKKDSL